MTYSNTTNVDIHIFILAVLKYIRYILFYIRFVFYRTERPSNYCNLLQQSPDVVHQFYNDASTMVRVDDLAGTNTTASTMMVTYPSSPLRNLFSL